MRIILAFFTVICLFLIMGCNRKTKDNDPCSSSICDWPISPAFHFTIRDRSTGRDLFFSPSPAFPFSALTISFPKMAHGWGILVDTIGSRHDFLTGAGSDGKDTLYFQIAGTQTDTLIYASKSYKISCCGTSSVMANITYNGQFVKQEFDTYKFQDSVLVFYK